MNLYEERPDLAPTDYKHPPPASAVRENDEKFLSQEDGEVNLMEPLLDESTSSTPSAVRAPSLGIETRDGRDRTHGHVVHGQVVSPLISAGTGAGAGQCQIHILRYEEDFGSAKKEIAFVSTDDAFAHNKHEHISDGGYRSVASHSARGLGAGAHAIVATYDDDNDDGTCDEFNDSANGDSDEDSSSDDEDGEDMELSQSIEELVSNTTWRLQRFSTSSFSSSASPTQRSRINSKSSTT